MREEWQQIKGFEGLYEVSSLGNVRNSVTLVNKSKSGNLGPRARYKYVTLFKNNIGKKIQIHRLVAKAFIQNPMNFPYVLHIKNDRSDNTVSNLKWGTQYHNYLDAVREGTYKLPPIRRGNANNKTKLTPEKVLKIRELATKHTQEALAKIFGVGRGAIRGVLEKTSWKYL